MEAGSSPVIRKFKTAWYFEEKSVSDQADSILAHISTQKVWILSKSINLQVSITVLDQNISSAEHFEGRSFFN